MTIDISPDHAAIVRAILAAHLPGNVTVWVFGSRAKGTARAYSDLDLALETPTPLPSSLLSDLAEAFDESDLPWKVDLIDWATTSEDFRTIVTGDRVMLIAPKDAAA